MINKQSKHKVIYLELIRVFALFFVLYTHTGQRGMHYYQVCDNGISYWMSMFMTLVSQTSVCLFFMISGALLLGRKDSFATVWTKRIPRIAIVTVIFVILQYLYKVFILSSEVLDIKNLLKYIYHGGSITQQWYLYAYIGFLCILPFLQRMVQALEGKFPYYFLLCAAVIIDGLCPLFERVMNWEEAGFGISIPLLTNVIVYPMLGYYLHCLQDETDRKFNILMVVVAVPVFAVNTVLVQRGYINTGEINSLTYFTAIYSYVFFVLLKLIGQNIKEESLLAKLILFAGSGVFGAYLFEPQLRDITVIIYDVLKPYILQVPALCLWLATALILGVTFSNILKLIPGIKKLL